MNNIMIDIETLGMKPNAVITEIAAVPFNLDGEVGKSVFSSVCSPVGEEKDIFSIDYDTVQWWTTQDAFGLRSSQEMASIYKALDHLSFYLRNYDDPRIWANGVMFDVNILETAYRLLDISVPWNFRRVMDVRTITNLLPDIKANTEFLGKRHCAVDDCMHQIRYLTATLKALKERT